LNSIPANVNFYIACRDDMEWPPYLDKSQGADKQLTGEEGKRYTFTRTNEHSGQRFRMTILERGDRIKELLLAF